LFSALLSSSGHVFIVAQPEDKASANITRMVKSTDRFISLLLWNVVKYFNTATSFQIVVKAALLLFHGLVSS